MGNLSEDLAEQVTRQFNTDFKWENYERRLNNGEFSMVALLELFKGGILKPEDIIQVDAERINELKNKENLNGEEKTELDLRQRGDLFYDRRRKRYSAVNFWGMMSLHEEGSIYKEVGYISESVIGFLDGEEVELERIQYDIEPASLEELKAHDPEQAKLFERVIYRGKIGQNDLEGENAQTLLGQYAPFAKKRTEEIKNLINLKKLN
jgi:hypothetical protein